MRYRRLFPVVIFLIIATSFTRLIGLSQWWTYGMGAASLIATSCLWRDVVRPMKAVENGIYLLREQDFASRLRHIGHADADKVVNLFNSLMATMKSERLKLKEQNGFLNQIIESSPMGICVYGFDGSTVKTNPAFRRLVTTETNRFISTLRPGDVVTLRPGPAYILRCSCLHFMDNGFERRFVLIEQMTDAIAEAEHTMFCTIVRTMGHEVNNTLGSVISVLESLRDLLNDNSSVTIAADGSIRSCRMLGEFVKRYAEVVKLPQPRFEEIDLGKSVRNMQTALIHLLPKNVTLSFTTVTGIIIRADMTLLERVIVNAVKNACESIGDRPGHIEIAVSANHKLTITDNGRGISEEASRKIFTPFFSTKHPDRGIGLMLISEILRLHHAEFTLSTSPVTGLTTLSVLLPSY